MKVKLYDSKRLWDIGGVFLLPFPPLTCELFDKERKNRLYPCHNQPVKFSILP